MPKFGHVDVNSNLKTISSSRLACRLSRTKLGGVLPIFAFWVQCLFYFETKLGGSHAQIPNVNVLKSICASRSNKVLVTERRSVSLNGYNLPGSIPVRAKVYYLLVNATML